jgi:DNA-binding NtrC family response regulator
MHELILERPTLIGTSPAMRNLEIEIASAARSHAKVLVTGETGVGKEVIARTIHQRSARQAGPFVTINCAGVPDSLLESEFFGHAKGSFTGAFRDNAGLLRQAHGGTILLDEVAEMSTRMQALLLRFLETGEIQTVGGNRAGGALVDVRVITATNRDLSEAVMAREFRADLFYRLNVLCVSVPPLRDRRADVQALVEHYLGVFATQHHTPTPALSQAALDLLVAHSWPGNVRELKNVVERLVLRTTGPVVEPDHLPAEIVASSAVAAAAADRALAEALSPTPHQARVQALLNRLLVGKESFWTTVYPSFMMRDITRDDLRFIVQTGLERTRGSYRLLVEHFNMPAGDYKRVLGFLRQHDCHLPFQRFRMTSARRPSGV